MEKPFYEFNLNKEKSLLNELNQIYDFCSDTSNYTKLILRGPEWKGFNNNIQFFNSYEDLISEYYKISQYITNNPQSNIGQFSLYGESIIWEKYPGIYKFIFDKIINLYGGDIFDKKNIKISEGLLTMYKKNGVLSKHRDGTSYELTKSGFTKPSNILLYLNKDYKKEWGGCFIVDGVEVIPEFGKLVFLNFRNGNDPEHEVSVLKEDINRIALLFNITYQNKDNKIFNN